MKNIDKNRIIEAICKYISPDIDAANRMCARIELINDDLEPVIDEWISSGIVSEKGFNGVKISDIMKKEKCNFIRALYTMSVLIDNPELADNYNKMKQYYDDVRGI